MTFTNSELADAVDALSALEATGKFGYAVAKNLRKMRSEAQAYINFREELLLKYGEPDPDKPERVKINPTNMAKFRAEIAETAAETVEIDVYTVSEDMFIDSGLNSSQMEKLVWMVKEE